MINNCLKSSGGTELLTGSCIIGSSEGGCRRFVTGSLSTIATTEQTRTTTRPSCVAEARTTLSLLIFSLTISTRSVTGHVTRRARLTNPDVEVEDNTPATEHHAEAQTDSMPTSDAPF